MKKQVTNSLGFDCFSWFILKCDEYLYQSFILFFLGKPFLNLKLSSRHHSIDFEGIKQTATEMSDCQLQLEQAKDEVKRAKRALHEAHVKCNAELRKRTKKISMVNQHLKEEIDRCKQAEKSLRESENRFRSTLDSILEGCQIIDHDWRYVYVNNSAAKQLRKRKSELFGHTMREVFPNFELTNLYYLIQRSLKDGFPLRTENELGLPDGSKGWFEFRIEPVPMGIIIFSIDITTRRIAEEKVKQSTEELKRSNTELDQLAYTMSHDFKQPLRMISSFSQLLDGEYKGRLDKNADEYIKYIIDGTNTLQQMIEDMLVYSRIGTRGKTFEATNFNDILNQALANLKMVIDENQAIITHDSLPQLMADPSQITRLFQNLIDNAIKFRKKAEFPKIHVSALQRQDEWVFSVIDNGIGIQPELFGKLFKFFQRLQGDEYPGTGMGLAISKKIVERHGGRIWVESQPGKGSVFYFTIPVK